MYERNWTPDHLPNEGTSPREEAAGTWPVALVLCSGLLIGAALLLSIALFLHSLNY